jgi:hypothetical protein
MQCSNCKKEIIGVPIKIAPNRGLLSPNPSNCGLEEKDSFYWYFCSKECKKETEGQCYVFWAQLDRNASDSECFVHDHWETNDMGDKLRVGHCNITGDEIRVYPLESAIVSGQPSTCTEHFKLKKNYFDTVKDAQQIIDNLENKKMPTMYGQTSGSF